MDSIEDTLIYRLLATHPHLQDIHGPDMVRWLQAQDPGAIADRLHLFLGPPYCSVVVWTALLSTICRRSLARRH